MKRFVKLFILLLLCLFTCIVSSCKKDNEDDNQMLTNYERLIEFQNVLKKKNHDGVIKLQNDWYRYIYSENIYENNKLIKEVEKEIIFKLTMDNNFSTNIFQIKYTEYDFINNKYIVDESEFFKDGKYLKVDWINNIRSGYSSENKVISLNITNVNFEMFNINYFIEKSENVNDNLGEEDIVIFHNYNEPYLATVNTIIDYTDNIRFNKNIIEGIALNENYEFNFYSYVISNLQYDEKNTYTDIKKQFEKYSPLDNDFRNDWSFQMEIEEIKEIAI